MDWVEVSYQEGLQNHLAVHKIFREFGALVWDEIDQQGDEPLFWSILVLLILAMLQHREFHSFYKLLLIEPLQLRPEFYFITRPLNQIRAHGGTIPRIPSAFWWSLSKFDRRGSVRFDDFWMYLPGKVAFVETIPPKYIPHSTYQQQMYIVHHQ